VTTAQFLTQAASADSRGISITVQPPLSGDGFIAKYVTFPHNLPSTYSNRVFVWDAEGATVPWNQPPNGDAAVPTDSLTGDVPVEMAIQRRGYIIGYAVAPTPAAVCSTVFIPAAGQSNPETWSYRQLSISVPAVGIDTIQVSYKGLPTYDPAATGNWIGIWRGSEVRYSGDPLKAAPITRPEADGTLFLGELDLKIGNDYSVGYFMWPCKQGGRTSLSAMATFRV
jgi:hypothetical protein